MIRKGFIWKKTTKSKVRKLTRKKKTKIIEVQSEIIPHMKNSIFVCDHVPTEENRAKKKFTLTPQESPRKQNDLSQIFGPEEIIRRKRKRAPKEKLSSQKKQKTEKLKKTPEKIPEIILFTSEKSSLLKIVIDRNPTKIPHKIFAVNPGKNLQDPCLDTSSKKKNKKKKKKRNKKKLEDPTNSPKSTKSPKATKKRKRSESEFEKQNPSKKHKNW